ncbi:MAG TPA: helix-turn-helix domain-containing protein [Acidimicrobiales bacterium]|jgi:transcriptional regulator GlxA family with amidase domain|nr:helix-turn-helix domain-containing protein [Acidimicrobiales bacterium]
MERSLVPWPHTVVAVTDDVVSPFELSVACEVFGIDRSELVDPWYRFVLASVDGAPVRTNMGFTIHPDRGLDALEEADSVVIPAGFGNYDCPPVELLDALRAAHARGARLMSLCSGAFVLAATGLLDGRRATTHWMHAERLAELHPSIDVDPTVLYVDEGDILTSAGTAAGIDMCLHVVRKDLGAEVANAVARRMVVPPHRDGGQAQFVDLPVPTCTSDDPLTELLDWMAENLDQQVAVDELARRAHMSPRHFARRFRAATGTTPHQWLLTQRVLFAQRLLESTDYPVELVAQRCGFGSAAALRVHFQKVTNTSPQSYRRTFRAAS